MTFEHLPIRPLLLCEERMRNASEKHCREDGSDPKGKDCSYLEHLDAAMEHLAAHKRGERDPDGTHFVGFVTRALLALDAILDSRERKCACSNWAEYCCEACSEHICSDCASYIDPPGSHFCNSSAETECGRNIRSMR